MHCTHCRRINRPDAAFCDTCGAKLAGPESDALMPVADTALPEGKVRGSPRLEQANTLHSLADGVFVGRQAEMGVL